MGELETLLQYEPLTGRLVWKVRRGSAQAGDDAGCINAMGYHVVRVGGKLHYAHRIAWLFVYGRWPDNEIDHINGCRSDNRIENLRCAEHAENCRNLKKNSRNTSGYKGVYRHAGGWRARIRGNGRHVCLGVYPTAYEAAVAYDAAAEKYHREFARTNKMMEACHR